MLGSGNNQTTAEDGAMSSIPQDEMISKLPVAELQADPDRFLELVLRRLPEKRLGAVAKLAVQGILGSQSPVLTQMARGVVREEKTIWPAAKRLYRFVGNKRFSHRDLLKGCTPLPRLPWLSMNRRTWWWPWTR